MTNSKSSSHSIKFEDLKPGDLLTAKYSPLKPDVIMMFIEPTEIMFSERAGLFFEFSSKQLCVVAIEIIESESFGLMYEPLIP